MVWEAGGEIPPPTRLENLAIDVLKELLKSGIVESSVRPTEKVRVLPLQLLEARVTRQLRCYEAVMAAIFSVSVEWASAVSNRVQERRIIPVAVLLS